MWPENGKNWDVTVVVVVGCLGTWKLFIRNDTCHKLKCAECERARTMKICMFARFYYYPAVSLSPLLCFCIVFENINIMKTFRYFVIYIVRLSLMAYAYAYISYVTYTYNTNIYIGNFDTKLNLSCKQWQTLYRQISTNSTKILN